MALLFPLYLLGAAAIALPIYLHLRRKPPQNVVEFSSIMFLEPTMQSPVKRRSQLENWPLLLLRCLALLVLAAIFARPFLEGDAEAASVSEKRTVVVLDTSASMGREGLWEQAMAELEKIAPPLAIISAGAAPKVEVPFGAPLSMETLAPGWESADLGSALAAAAELVDEGPAEIVVISDLQSGSDLGAAATAAWADGVSVRFAGLIPDATTNASITAAPSSDTEITTVRVRNDPASEGTTFTLTAGDESRAAVVPAGESRVFEFPGAPATIELSGDDHIFDNVLYSAPRDPAPVDLLFLGEAEAADSTGEEFYFRRAFGESRVLVPRYVSGLEESPSITAVARVLSPAETAALRAHVAKGARVLLVLTDVAMADTLAGLAGLEGAPALVEKEGGFALLEEIDFDHPSLVEFRDPRWRDFTGVHFWKHREMAMGDLPPGADVVAKFDSGAPAWFEFPVGEGSVFVMASGWQPADSQLALSSKFLPLLYSIFADAGARVTAPGRYYVGGALPSDFEGTAEKPGIYAVGGRPFAVNLPPSESDLTPVGEESFAALGVPLVGRGGEVLASSPSGTVSLRAAESEARQQFWRIAILVLLALLAFESWFSFTHDPVVT